MAIAINGSGTITGISQGGLNDNIITQAELATTGVAGNGPAFSAYPNTVQTLSSGTWTKILYQSEEYDTNNNFASSTFTPTVAGYYQVIASMQVSASYTNGLMAIYKNGSTYKNGYATGGAVTGNFNVTCYVYCNGTTDYIEAYGFIGTGQTLSSSSTVTYFQGALVRAA